MATATAQATAKGTNMNEEEQYERVCKGEFAEIGSKLDRIDSALRGNGKPGINTRLDRLEQDAKRISRVVWIVCGAGVTVVGALLVRLL